MDFYFIYNLVSQYVSSCLHLRRHISASYIISGCLALACPTVSAQTILIIKNRTSTIHSLISTQVENELKKTLPNADITSLDLETATLKKLIILQPALVITLGKKAAREIEYAGAKKLYALIPKRLYSSLNNCTQKVCTPHSQNYAIHLDQPIERQMNLLHLILPNAKKIGTLVSRFSIENIDKLEKTAKKLKLDLVYQYLPDEHLLNQKLNELLRIIDVFLALPDPLVHNRNTIQHFLLLTYRHEVPVIGFSKAYVNAGAVAAVYSTYKQISRQISQLSVKILSKKPPPPDSYPPRYFSVAINQHVSRSLDLSFPSPKVLELKLLALEK